MRLISHRGNLNGPIEERENSLVYIDEAVYLGYDVEVDVWKVDEELFLGHNIPQHRVNISWIQDRARKLWVHCKNVEALEFFNGLTSNINYFWHQEDTATLTSKKHIWAYPGSQPIKNSIAVLPELLGDNISECYGICSDYIIKYNI
jgi:hypothetical protein